MEAVWDDFEAVMERVAHYQDSTASRQSLEWGIEQAVADLSLSVLGDGSEYAQRMLDFAVADDIELEYAGKTSDLDLWWFDSDGELDGGDVLLPGGYVELMEAISTDLTITYNSTVTRIEYGKRGVTVTATEPAADGEEVVYSADYLVVTVPVGVLRASPAPITFDPPMPSAWSTALSHRGVGLLDKYVFAFKSSFFADTHFLYHVDSTTKGRYSEWLNGNTYLNGSKASQSGDDAAASDGTGANVLAAFNAAAFAAEIGDNATDAEVKWPRRACAPWPRPRRRRRPCFCLCSLPLTPTLTLKLPPPLPMALLSALPTALPTALPLSFLPSHSYPVSRHSCLSSASAGDGGGGGDSFWYVP